jgi:hypothetical protein
MARRGAGDLIMRDPTGSFGSRRRRISPEELRDASARYKEIQGELSQIGLVPETRNGEDRLDRYDRELRLRAMREDFQATAQTPLPSQQRNGVMLALVMTVASFLLCAFCAGGTYFGLILLNTRPDPQTVADNFWSAMQARDYGTVHDNYLSPVLRFTLSVDEFARQAQIADSNDGVIQNVTPISTAQTHATIGNTQAALPYQVTRAGTAGKPYVTTITLVLVLSQNSWGVNDLGALLTPPVPATPTPTGQVELIAGADMRQRHA